MSQLLTRAWQRMWHHPGHLIWLALAYVPFVGFMSVPLTGDQKVYLSTAMEMWQRGSWLRPILFGESSYYKPPLQYWATILGWKIAGFNLWGALLPSVICVLLTAWLIGEIAQILYPKKPMNHAGLWFGASVGTAVFGMVAQMEIYLVLFYAFAWWAGLKFLDRKNGVENQNSENSHFFWLYLAFGAAGLSALIKSPLYSVFWVVGYFSYLIIVGEWEFFRDRRLYYALAFGILIGIAWFVAVGVIDGNKFWADYALRETWNKKGGNSGSIASVWIALLYYCLPFTFLVVPSIRTLIKKNRQEHVFRFLFAWSWAPAVFFSFYPYRTKPYLYLLVPVVCLLVDWGYLFDGRSRWFRIWTLVTGLVLLVVAIFLAVVLIRADLLPLWIVIGFVLSGAVAALFAFRNSMIGLILASLTGVFFFHAASVILGEWDIRDLRAAVAKYPNASVAFLDEKKNIWSEVGLLSAAIGKPIERLSDYTQVADALQAGEIVILDDEQSVEDLRSLEAKIAGRGDTRALAQATWTRWSGRKKFPFRELIFHGREAVQDFDKGLRREFWMLKLL